MASHRLLIEAESDGSPVIAPVPLSGLGRRLTDVDVKGASVVDTITADSGQRAYLLEPIENRLVLQFVYIDDNEADLPDWVWQPPSNSLSDASPELAEYVRGMCSYSNAETVRRLADHVVSRFTYGAGPGRFTDGKASVPLACGTIRGTCIDIHTYFSAALRAAQIDAAYIAGVFIREEAIEANDMHCWVAVRDVSGVQEWDLSHALIANRDPAPNLTEIPGRRVVLSSGRGMRFATGSRSCRFSHLALPCDLQGKALPARATIEAV